MLEELNYLPLINFFILTFIAIVVVVAYRHIIMVINRVETALRQAEEAIRISQEAKKTAKHAEIVSESMIKAASEWRDL